MDSRDSSPRSLDATDTNNHHRRNPSFDDQPNPPKVKLMCSYGGRIQPRPHHNHLTYVAGDTKILAVDRHIKFSTLASKLSSLSNSTTSSSFFKYQLPGEDLDALISVTNDEDLHHMMIEYDRLSRSSPRPSRLRLFLFPHNTSTTTTNPNFPHSEPKPEPQWFIDALNSVQVPLLEGSPPPPPDFLFGFDKSVIPPNNISPESNNDSSKDNNNQLNANNQVIEKLVPESEPDFEHEIQELKRMYIGNNEQQQQPVQQKSNEENGNGVVHGVNNGAGDGYARKTNNAEKVTAPLMTHSHAQGTVTGTVPFLQERNNAAYSLGVPTTGNGIFLIQTPSGIYQAVRPVTGPVGQTVYLVPAPGSEVSVAAERGYAAARGGDGWM